MIQMLICLFVTLTAMANVIEAPVNPVDFMQNPAQVNWRKIDTENFEIIFPDSVESEAQRVAHLLEKVFPYVTRSLEAKPPRLSLVLQAHSTISNGFVTLAPRRSEWYLTPAIDPELGSTEWLHTLAVHEFRHVVQFQKSKQGFNKIYYYLLGEIGQAVGIGMTMPPWLLEGDAVGIETALTRGGRGRLPLFERDLRTLLLSGKKFDYDKAHLGSYKDYIPNHYVYGYFYTTYLRNKYGDLFLSRLVDRATDEGYNPLSFYRAVDQLTGERFEKFYKSTMRDLVRHWKSKIDLLSPTPYEVKSLHRKWGWTNYHYPQKVSDEKYLALKSGLSFIPQFVLIDGKKEKTLFYPAPLVGEYPFKLRNKRLAFVEYELDPRWGYRDFGRLKVYDLDTDRFVMDVRKTKVRLAVLDHQAQNVVGVEWNVKQGQFITVLDLKGKIQQRESYPADKVITSIDWLNSDQVVMVTKDHDGLKRIVKYDFKTKSEVELLAPKRVNIGFITSEKGNIFFESPESGIDNIFLLENGQTKRQLTSSLFGAYAPHLKDEKLIYSDYTVDGMNIVEKSLHWNEAQNSSDSFVPFYEKFSKSEKIEELESDLLKKEKLQSQPYSQFKHAPNLHSWILLAPPLSNTITAQIYSRDILNKFSLSAGGEYNLNERTTTGFVSTAWSHLYTVFDLRGAYGNRRQDLRQNGRRFENKWEEGTFDAGVSVPWRKLTGRFSQQFVARAFSRFIKVTNKLSRDRSDINDGALLSPGGEVSYSILSRTARRDIYPEWGSFSSGRFEEGSDITGEKQNGALTSLDQRFYLPGLFKHHSFFHQIAYERQRDNNYQYSSYIYYPRGTDSFFLQEFTKYSGNYTLPLLNPDAHWSRYVYFKRIYGNLFYDQLNGRYGNFSYEAATYGWELLFETHLLRLFLPITWGVRGSYVIKGAEENDYEIFLSQALGVF